MAIFNSYFDITRGYPCLNVGIPIKRGNALSKLGRDPRRCHLGMQRAGLKQTSNCDVSSCHQKLLHPPFFQPWFSGNATAEGHEPGSNEQLWSAESALLQGALEDSLDSHDGSLMFCNHDVLMSWFLNIGMYICFS